MSKTIFWYLFRDLVRIFVMTSLVLAGIMSFGGLLRPLMEYGLSASQAGKMLLYFMPAMMTYSLPIAALFATTVVYGRLSADNELTACRAGGISHLALTLPAMVLGLALSIVSLLSLSFLVPRYILRVEKVAFDSLAEVVVKNIQRTHQLRIEDYVIYAESAQILPRVQGGDTETVVLHGPMFASYDEDPQTRTKIPSEFFTARSATVLIRQADDRVEFSVELEDGTSFPRVLGEGDMGGVGTGQIGPIPVRSPIDENTKFLDIHQLKRLYEDPTRSREIREMHTRITRQEQQQLFLGQVAAELKRTGQYVFQGTGSADQPLTYVLRKEPEAVVAPRPRGKLLVSSNPELDQRQIRLERVGTAAEFDEARGLTLRVEPRPAAGQIVLEFNLEDVRVETGEGSIGGSSRRRYLYMPMPPEVAAIGRREPTYYLTGGTVRGDDLRTLRRELPQLRNSIEAEIHGRASFAVSCLILVTSGCALGMMFRAGNYLSAFSVSVVPALICIALVVTGQHVSENSSGGLAMGLAIVWSGNVMVLVLAIGLLGHLRRQ